ncbi:hypothetical protein [Pseudomonas sp. RGM 3321]|uniref:hypothetical protein n=1 Tax=Pseudomonas sp. RGM 3321 TaxID=2930089 RepID=UPI001FCBD533|nr:hypothetical protein [Pseudomonas sp. RGM 3321]MCJ2373883.1 hypothetical protein [Pseudomonas sp. RGM 3321]
MARAYTSELVGISQKVGIVDGDNQLNLRLAAKKQRLTDRKSTHRCLPVRSDAHVPNGSFQIGSATGEEELGPKSQHAMTTHLATVRGKLGFMPRLIKHGQALMVALPKNQLAARPKTHKPCDTIRWKNHYLSVS